MITVQVSGFLTGFTGGRTTIPLDGAPATVADALTRLWIEYPGLRDRVVNELGEVRPHVSIFVNDDHIRHREALATPLGEGDDLTILPAISGGSRRGRER
jgi:molybdopterin synthase sulfur carrier subunit